MTSYYSRRLICAILVLCMALSLASAALAYDDLVSPVVSDVEFDMAGHTMKPGDTFTVKCKAADASGIRSVNCRFRHETASRSFYSAQGVYNADTGYYEMACEIPASIQIGKYVLYSVSAGDIYGNYANADTQLLHDTYWIEVVDGVNDIVQPTVSDIVFNAAGQTMKPGDTFTVKCKAADASGIRSVNCRFRHETASRSFYSAQGVYNADTGYYEMACEIPASIQIGKYVLYSVSAGDIYGNYANADTQLLHDTYWIEVIEGTKVYIDGTIGTPSDGKIIDVPANKKYQIRADYGRWANYWYQIKSDGFVGDPITSQTRYEDVPILKGTSINGLSNGYHYTLMEVRETATPTDRVEIPSMPAGTNYVVYELSPFDSMYEYLTSQKEAGETTLGSYDIDVSGDIPAEGVLVSFNVGMRHRGKTLYVLHYHNNEVKRYEGTVDEQGVLTIRVYGFSPFMIVEPPRSTPSTPTTTSTSAISGGAADSGTNYQGEFSQGRFLIEADCGKQTGVSLDGKPLQRDVDYTVSCMNGTDILLSDSLLRSMDDKQHTLIVYFTDGSASATFTAPTHSVYATSTVASVPATGQYDATPLGLCCASVLMLFACIGRKKTFLSRK